MNGFFQGWFPFYNHGKKGLQSFFDKGKLGMSELLPHLTCLKGKICDNKKSSVLHIKDLHSIYLKHSFALTSFCSSNSRTCFVLWVPICFHCEITLYCLFIFFAPASTASDSRGNEICLFSSFFMWVDATFLFLFLFPGEFAISFLSSLINVNMIWSYLFKDLRGKVDFAVKSQHKYISQVPLNK